MLLACSFDIAIIRGFLWFTVALAVGLAVNQILTLFRNYLESVHIESRIMSNPSSCYPDPVRSLQPGPASTSVKRPESDRF
jgi:hypothetical protein